jgi:hypothetical protein
LTFKSIDAILAGEQGDNARWFLPALDADESHKREIIMTPALHDWCYEQDSRKSLNYKANLRAFLKRFVVGLTVDNEDYFKNWKRRIFEVRLQLAPPKSDNTRVFGGFVRPDVFFAAHEKPRDWFEGHPDRWDQAISEAEAKLEAAFPGQTLMLPKPFSNCVTHNAHDHDLD